MEHQFWYHVVKEGGFTLKKINSKEIMAFIPVYVQLKGNCTLVYRAQGERDCLDVSLRSFLNHLAQEHFIDLRSIRKYYGSVLGIKNLVPIPLNYRNVFIPIKVRRPICRNDGSIGYINIEYIERTVENQGETIVHLRNNIKIKSLNSLPTVKKHIANGQIVKHLYRDKNNIDCVHEYDFYNGYNKPATKGDIALLIEEISKIIGSIK